MKPISWMCPSQEESAPHPSPELLQQKEKHKDLDQATPGMETKAQPMADHPQRTQPAVSPPCSEHLSVSTYGAKRLTPNPSASLGTPQTRIQDVRTTTTGLQLPTRNTQASSRLHTPERCEFCHLNQDQITTFSPQIQSKEVQTESPEGHLPPWLSLMHSRPWLSYPICPLPRVNVPNTSPAGRGHLGPAGPAETQKVTYKPGFPTARKSNKRSSGHQHLSRA